MLGLEMMLKAVGVTDEQIGRLRVMLDPDKIEAMALQYRARFEATEAAVLNCEKMLRALLGERVYNNAMGDPVEAELMRQMQLTEGIREMPSFLVLDETNRIIDHDDTSYINGNAPGSDTGTRRASGG